MSSDSDDLPRTTIEPASPSLRSRAWDTLQRLAQPVETVTRQAVHRTTGGNVEDIDPPEDIDELYALYEEIGLIRANLNQFVSDVWKPGVRLEADSDATVDYFLGGDNAPESAPDGGFLSECMVTDEKRQPFVAAGGKPATLNRWARGTVLIEKLKQDEEDPESQITGFRHIRPETVSARTYPNTNILVAPDDTENADMTTKRDEAAAFVQFDEQAILARRFQRTDGNRGRNFDDETPVPLSQNDVLKQTLDQNIGGEDPENGVFGVSIIRAIKDDAEEYRNIKRDRAEAIKRKAWGLWTAQYTPEVIETENETIIIEWPDGEIDAMQSEIESLGPGEMVHSDASLILERHDAEVPELGDTLDHYVDDILTPLPAPKFATGHEGDINRRVTQEQDPRYQDIIEEERHLQEESWTQAFRDVAERHDDLDPSGLQLKIEPEPDDSPVMSLDNDTVERIGDFADAIKAIYGPGGAPAFIQEQILNELVLQLPEEASLEGDEAAPDDLSLEDVARLREEHDGE